MPAETIRPAPTFFEKLLSISGGPWYRHFLARVVMPIRYRLFEPRDPAAFISKIQAETVRGVARDTGIECSPRLLKEPESCPTCRNSVRMLVEPPYNVCFDCFGDISLDSN